MATKSDLIPPTSAKLHGHVVSALRERILSGFYQAGEWLPAERVLTTDLSVHRKVVRTAIAQLEKEGLLVRRPNCRPVVQAAASAEDAVGPEDNSRFSESRLVALSMWRGGGSVGSAQQRIFWGMNQALGQAGYHGVFLDLGEQVGTVQQNAVREALHLRYVLDHGFGGTIFYPYAYDENRELIQEVSRRMPLVLIDRMVAGVEADFAGAQNRQAVYDAVMHLTERGHRRIAYLTKSESILPVQERLQGYLVAMRDVFPETMTEIVLTAPVSGSDYWYVFDAVFRLPAGERPTALICVNDIEAMRAANRLAELGLSAPEDVSLIGFDNIVSELPNGIGLTTVGQPFEEIGKAAAKLFLRRIDDRAGSQVHVELPTQLIERESVQSLPLSSN
ncbi:hypothetical protein CCAX7_32180 [Capsulimonas corticalis]|uniref:Uncharacterized protein n=1 Tax=Capsulimonas corticalis TaxID=2219043 RepID=A0A402D429_9BACT|nr:GntR family transcriptional regulator [Capsulimonas corticalis]BDI31167.1 hypothetical protein CCAX7_32180 [Capsulimonas corticalis]